MYLRQVGREGVRGHGRKDKFMSLTPYFHSSGHEPSLLEITLVLNIHGTQVLERIVPFIAANDLWTVITHKRHFSAMSL